MCFFDLFLTDLSRCIICHSRRFDDDIRIIRLCHHGFIHLLCTFHRDRLYKHRRFQCYRTADQCHVRPAQHSHFGDGIAHSAGRMIGDKTHRINGFSGRSRCHQKMLSGKVFFVCDLTQDILQEHFRFRHLSGTGVATGKVATGRLDHLHAIFFQGL